MNTLLGSPGGPQGHAHRVGLPSGPKQSGDPIAEFDPARRAPELDPEERRTDALWIGITIVAAVLAGIVTHYFH